MFIKFNIFNRPISPHLLVYSPQLSSLFSIWHRLSGIILISLLTISLLTLKGLLIINFNSIFYYLEIIFFAFQIHWILNYFYLFILYLFLYHSLNGIRHIVWDLGFFLNTKGLSKSSFTLMSIIFLVLVINLINLQNA